MIIVIDPSMALAWVFERRSVLPQVDSDRFLSLLSSLPFLTEAEPTSDRRARILALARGHGLSSYDATYLELAQRLGAALAIGVELYWHP